MWLVDPHIHANCCVADYDVRGGAFAPSRIDNSLRFQMGIAPPCEQLRWVDPYAPRYRRNARNRLHAFGYRLSLELI
ncbi:hypothetical protein IE4872_PC00395 (plasmid) [Rhizobium gallicum]|uniref:Uncharacterized protein n=1 Tax=Rhizobium gallicum TaxID=56730 RepID=A0A1L5NRB1_9HYPH|nr:hypothetical protein IE4872_PC00395 [Rhizobium gallicum]